MVRLFCFYYNIVLPRTQHTFAEERVLRPRGTRAGKKEETCYLQFFTPNWENRNATWVFLYPFKCCGLLTSISSLPNHSLVFSVNVYTWYGGGTRRRAAGPVILGNLRALDSLDSWSCCPALCKSCLCQFLCL